MAIVVRIEPELEQQLDQLAQRLGRSRSACVGEAIAQFFKRLCQNDEAKRQSVLIAQQLQDTE